MNGGASTLQRAMLDWAGKGYVVVRQRSNFVEMRKPKRFSPKWAAAWVIAGIPLPGAALLYGGGYAVWHSVRKERVALLLLDSDGSVGVEELEG